MMDPHMMYDEEQQQQMYMAAYMDSIGSEQEPSMDVAPLYMPMGLPPSFNFPRRGPPMPSMMVRPELVKQGNQARYKTELCRAFQDKGVCKYGEKCQFAHGSNELRSLPRHPKYKTEMCRTFHSTGICPYGPRCHFIHNSEAEVRPMRDGHVSAPIRGDMAMLPFPPMQFDPYMRANSMPSEDYHFAHQFLPVHMDHLDEGHQYMYMPGMMPMPMPMGVPMPMPPPAPALVVPHPNGVSVSAPATPAGASVSPSPPESMANTSPPSGIASARSPPVNISEAEELLGAVRLSTPPESAGDRSRTPDSPLAHSPRRLPVFSAFKQ